MWHICVRRKKMENTLINLSDELAGVVQSLNPYVVSVRARRHYPSSGLRWSPEIIVTADHTVQREEDIAITFADGKTIAATVVGRDPGTDLAVLRVEGSVPLRAELGRTQATRTGELAVVVGRSPDSGPNASLGIVSAVSGPWRTWRGGNLDAYIRVDAKLFPQSSGGAVVNVRGEIVGIATSALSRIGGLAIPGSTIQRVAEKLVERGFVPRGYLGIGVQPVPFSEELRQSFSVPNKSGLITLTVESNGPAAKAGLLIGDIVVALAGAPVEDTDDLQSYLDAAAIGSPVKVNFVRGGALQELTVTVGERQRRRS
jgi:S1-C subfamily serine protease